MRVLTLPHPFSEQIQAGKQEDHAVRLIHQAGWDSRYRPQQGGQEAGQRGTTFFYIVPKSAKGPQIISSSWTASMKLSCSPKRTETIQTEVREGERQVGVQPNDRAARRSARHGRGEESEQCESISTQTFVFWGAARFLHCTLSLSVSYHRSPTKRTPKPTCTTLL